MNTDEHRCESDDLRGFWDRLCTIGEFLFVIALEPNFTKVSRRATLPRQLLLPAKRLEFTLVV
jgi:hypothetical protein